jgi:hypothetical protein
MKVAWGFSVLREGRDGFSQSGIVSAVKEKGKRKKEKGKRKNHRNAVIVVKFYCRSRRFRNEGEN